MTKHSVAYHTEETIKVGHSFVDGSACHCDQIALDPYAYLKNVVYKACLDQGLCESYM
jgi:hypothetical protein